MNELTVFALLMIGLALFSYRLYRRYNAPDPIIPGFGVSGLYEKAECLYCPDEVYKLLIDGPHGPWHHGETGKIEGPTPPSFDPEFVVPNPHKATPYHSYDWLKDWHDEWYDKLYDPLLDDPGEAPVVTRRSTPRPCVTKVVPAAR